MQDFDREYLNSLAPFSPERKRELINYFKKQNENIHLEVFSEMLKNIARMQEGQDMGGSVENHYATFLVALDRLIGLERRTKQKRSVITKKEAKELYSFQFATVSGRKQKSAPMKNLIEKRHYHLIRKLRAKGLNWRQVADFLNRHRKFDVSFTYLRTTFKKIEKARGHSESGKKDGNSNGN